MDAASHDEAVGRLMSLQWAWDRRKTKQDTEERSLQEAGQRVFTFVQNVLNDKIEEDGWERAAKQFGGSVKAMCELLDVVESDINVEDYPMVMYEAGRYESEMEQRQEEEHHEGAA